MYQSISLHAVFDPGTLDPAVQARLGDPEVLAIWERGLFALSHGDDVTAELFGERFGHADRSSFP